MKFDEKRMFEKLAQILSNKPAKSYANLWIAPAKPSPTWTEYIKSYMRQYFKNLFKPIIKKRL